MTGYPSTDIPSPKTSNPFAGALGADLGVRYAQLRQQFEADHPELFPENERDLRREDSLALQAERNSLWTTSLGLDIPLVPSVLDYTQDASCLRCHDAGWVHPGSYASPVVPCRQCNAQEEQRDRARLAYAGIPEAQKAATFESFKVVKGTKDAYDATWALVEGAHFYMLLIYGTYGNGKTHLAYAACREATKTMRARFEYVPALIGRLRGQMDRGGSVQEIVDDLKNVAFLALDDYGAELGTQWQQSVIEEIINHRYANCGYTIVTTNRDITALPGPILSRFRDGQFCKMVLNEGVDYRPRKRSQ